MDLIYIASPVAVIVRQDTPEPDQPLVRLIGPEGLTQLQAFLNLGAVADLVEARRQLTAPISSELLLSLEEFNG